MGWGCGVGVGLRGVGGRRSGCLRGVGAVGGGAVGVGDAGGAVGKSVGPASERWSG